MSLVVVSGVSGAGKSTLIQYAITHLQNISNIIPITDRPPRIGESNGVDRYFFSTQKIQSLTEENQLCLINEVYSHIYGYFVQDILSPNLKFIELHHRVIHQLDSLCPHYYTICVQPIDICSLSYFLKKRNTEDGETFTRLQHLMRELSEIDELIATSQFNYIFTNDYTEKSKTRFLEQIQLIMEGSIV